MSLALAVQMNDSFPDWELPVFSIPKQQMNGVVRVVTRMASLSSIRLKLFGR
jgi:hypothetical protein